MSLKSLKKVQHKYTFNPILTRKIKQELNSAINQIQKHINNVTLTRIRKKIYFKKSL